MMNLSKPAFNSGLTLNFSELLLYSSSYWIIECDLVEKAYQMCVLINWASGLTMFGTEEVQKETFVYSKLSQIEDFKTLLNEQLGYPIVY